MRRRATENQIPFATAIAERLCIPKPNYNDFYETQGFISTNFDSFYLEKHQTLLRKRGLRTTYEFDRITKNLGNAHGIYCLFDGDDLLYIGISQTLGKRMTDSISEKNLRGSMINKIAYHITETYSDMRILEIALIAKYKPHLNKEYKFDGTPTIFVPDIDPYSLERYSIYEDKRTFSLAA